MIDDYSKGWKRKDMNPIFAEYISIEILNKKIDVMFFDTTGLMVTCGKNVVIDFFKKEKNNLHSRRSVVYDNLTSMCYI